MGDYLDALRLKGDAGRGQTVFARECKTCHKVGEVGVAIGPDLTGSPSRDPAALLSNILDPNPYVLPGYVQYVVVGPGRAELHGDHRLRDGRRA